jgi:glycosyltransferase involved in cell wall biosynthesis
MRQPLVSVLIPAYNAGAYLRPSLESILRQSHRSLEIWVVDDGSTDGSVDSLADLRDPRLHVLRQSNLGKSATLNKLLDGIRGEYYALQDADDLSHPDRIARQVDCLERHRDTAACFTGYDLIIGERRVAPRFRAKDDRQCAADIEALGMPGHDPTAMYRVSMAGNFRYDASLIFNEGHDLILRVGERFPMRVVGECLYSYRIHLESLTKRDPTLRLQCVEEVLRRACERRELDPAVVLAHLRPPGAPLRARDRDNELAAHFIESAIDQRESGDLRGALAAAAMCWRFNPRDPHYYKALLYALFPPAATRRLRRFLGRSGRDRRSR